MEREGNMSEGNNPGTGKAFYRKGFISLPFLRDILVIIFIALLSWKMVTAPIEINLESSCNSWREGVSNLKYTSPACADMTPVSRKNIIKACIRFRRKINPPPPLWKLQGEIIRAVFLFQYNRRSAIDKYIQRIAY